eukprot:gene16785-18480_t
MATTLDELTLNAIIDEISAYVVKSRDVLAIIGGIFAAKLCFSAASACYRMLKVYLLPKIWYQKDLRSKYGEWAVVTGASEGIGRSYCIELAKRGMNIILISRSFGKLEKVAKELEQTYKVKTKIISADLNKDYCFEEVNDELKDLDIGVLVNNVGIMYDSLQYFLTVDTQRLQEIINLNIMATVLMTRMLLPGMVSR